MTVLASFTIAMAALEWLAKALSPPPTVDPRLGILMFWLWVAVVGGVTYALSPYLDQAGPLDYLFWAIGALGWLAWKLGINEGWEDTPRDREEIWATSVGIILAVVAWDVRH